MSGLLVSFSKTESFKKADMGRLRTGTGYVSLNEGREHRLVLKALGIDIPEGAVVHHKDGNKRNNNPENLEVIMSQREHVKKEAGVSGEPDSHSYLPVTCPLCKKVRFIQYRNTKRLNFTGRCKSCSGGVK